MTCELCESKVEHCHYKTIMTDLFIPIPNAWVCHCGKPYVHYHKQEVPVKVSEIRKVLRRYMDDETVDVIMKYPS